MSQRKRSRYSSDSIAAGYSHDNEWMKSPPLAVVPPIYNTSIYFLPSTTEGEAIIAQKQPGYVYSRIANPTIDVCASVIAELEGAEGGTLLTSSGMAAISLVLLTFLKSGDHLVSQYPIDTHTIKLIEDLLVGNNIEVSWIDSNDSTEAYEKAIKPNTKVLFIESPSNPRMSLQDLEVFGKITQNHPQVITVVDGTFASPYLQQPLKYGVSISIHSCTKYMGGHSDITAGCVSFVNDKLMSKAQWYSTFLGSSLSPFDASLLHRSLKTLPLRMDRHSSNALYIAEFLEKHSKVEAVYYPGLESHPQHKIAKSQMKSFSGMISFVVVGGKVAGIKLVESVRLISLTVSLGGTGSLIEHPPSLTNMKSLMDENSRKRSGISDGLVRLSVGLEDKDELISDLTQALEQI